MTLQSGFTFQLWDEMRAHAQSVAESQEALPTLEACKRWLEAATMRHQIELPQHVFDFYASEMCSMIVELRTLREQGLK